MAADTEMGNVETDQQLEGEKKKILFPFHEKLSVEKLSQKGRKNGNNCAW